MNTAAAGTPRAFVKPEVLAPAGDPVKLRTAERFGADAVYLSGKRYGLRSACANFSEEELGEASDHMHARGKKLYLTVNTLPRADEYPGLERFLRNISGMGIDGFIAADPGVISLLREVMPGAKIHISTQAGVTSPRTALAYAAAGASRLVLARELGLSDISAIRAALPGSVSLEVFVHGAMCVSWSGRCLLSNALAGRDANRGECAQPCRWNYALIEEKRPGQPIPVEEDRYGTFIMSSKDLCLIDFIGELAAAGAASFKIEGRVKSAYYAAAVTGAYRIAVDALTDHVRAGGAPEDFRPDPSLMRELESVSHREYCTGFLHVTPAENAQVVRDTDYIRERPFLAVSAPGDIPGGAAAGAAARGERVFRFIQKNRVTAGDSAELLTPGRTGIPFVFRSLFDAEGNPVTSAPHPGMVFFASVDGDISPLEGDIVRGGGKASGE